MSKKETSPSQVPERVQEKKRAHPLEVQVAKSTGDAVSIPDDKLAINSRGRELLNVSGGTREGTDRVDGVLVVGMDLGVGRGGGLGTAVHATEGVSGCESHICLLHRCIQRRRERPILILPREKSGLD